MECSDLAGPRNVESIRRAMVQTSKPWVRHDPTGIRGGSSASRCLLRKAKMRAVFMVVADVFREQPFQMAFRSARRACRATRTLGVDDGVSAQKAAGVRPDSQAADFSASKRGERTPTRSSSTT